MRILGDCGELSVKLEFTEVKRQDPYTGMEGAGMAIKWEPSVGVCSLGTEIDEELEKKLRKIWLFSWRVEDEWTSLELESQGSSF